MTPDWKPRLTDRGRGLLVLLLLAAIVTVSAIHFRRPAANAHRHAASRSVLIAGEFNPPRMAPEFSLSGSDGSAVSLGRYRGKVVLLTFGFTYCAAVCPTTLATLAQARAGLGKRSDSVQVIFVTVDPARDSPAGMRTYLAAFDPAFIGATSDAKALAAVRRQYGVTAVRDGTGPDYAMAHTSSIFLIDRAGQLRAMMPFGHAPADFIHDIRYLLTH